MDDSRPSIKEKAGIWSANSRALPWTRSQREGRECCLSTNPGLTPVSCSSTRKRCRWGPIVCWWAPAFRPVQARDSARRRLRLAEAEEARGPRIRAYQGAGAGGAEYRGETKGSLPGNVFLSQYPRQAELRE